MKYKNGDNWRKYTSFSRLNDLKKPPEQIWCSHPIDVQIFDRCVAIVGSRRMTNYGRQVIEKLVPQLVADHQTIISGFMYGVDQYAHQVCVDCGSKTIAVVGWGINTPLFDYDKQLAAQIIKTGGAIISEWQDQPATLWTFPQRNRIVAALSSDVYVIEAAAKSGSLQTAEWATNLHRQLWAIPGPITSKTSVGTNGLIASGQAKPWLGQVSASSPLTDNPIIKLLESEPQTASDLARNLHRPIAIIGSQLSLLALTGKINERDGVFYPL